MSKWNTGRISEPPKTENSGRYWLDGKLWIDGEESSVVVERALANGLCRRGAELYRQDGKPVSKSGRRIFSE